MQSFRLDKEGKSIPSVNKPASAITYTGRTMYDSDWEGWEQMECGDETTPRTSQPWPHPMAGPASVIDHDRNKGVSKITQPGLDLLLEKHPFKEGDFVISASIVKQHINKIAVTVVLDVERDATKVKFPHMSYAAQPLLLTNLPTWAYVDHYDQANPWVRWTYCDLYRKMTDEEIKEIIGSDNDKLQDYILQIKEGVSKGTVSVISSR